MALEHVQLKNFMRIVTCLLAISTVFIAVGFGTDNWLKNSGEPPEGRFYSIGLWRVCWRNYRNQTLNDPREQYHGCWSIFNEHYDYRSILLRPPFYTVTQVFFSLCFTVAILSFVALGFYYAQEEELRKSIALYAIIGCNGLSALFGLIAALVFHINCKDDAWMPDNMYNSIGASFIVAVIGVFFEILIAATIYTKVVWQRGQPPRVEFEMRVMNAPEAAEPQEVEELLAAPQ